jgi:hypothetical protein
MSGTEDAALNPAPSGGHRPDGDNQYAQAARDRKCRAVLAHMFTHLGKLLANPVNGEMWSDAARDAGVPDLSGVSRARALEMLDGIAGRLTREK